MFTGSEGSPIVVRARNPHGAIIVGPFFVSLYPPHDPGDPGRSQNILNVKGSHYVIRGFVFRQGSAGIRVMSGSHGISFSPRSTLNYRRNVRK